MYSFTGTAALVAMTTLGFLLVTLLVFSFRDTVRSLKEFFDLALFRNLFRSRLRFSLKSLLIGVTVLPPAIAWLAHLYLNQGLPYPVLILIVVSYLLFLVIPLLYWSLVDAFGQSPRQRWRRFAEPRSCDVSQAVPEAAPKKRNRNVSPALCA